MKKFMVYLLCLSFLFAFSCGGDDKTPVNYQPSQPPATRQGYKVTYWVWNVWGGTCDITYQTKDELISETIILADNGTWLHEFYADPNDNLFFDVSNIQPPTDSIGKDDHGAAIYISVEFPSYHNELCYACASCDEDDLIPECTLEAILEREKDPP